MENRNPAINPNSVPVDGVDAQLSCAMCPSACCREGMIVPLTPDEANMMQSSGTEITQLDGRKNSKMAGKGREMYRLDSDCGNLQTSPDGAMSCRVYETSEYPQACREFTMGSYACALVQELRVRSGEDRRSLPFAVNRR